MLNGSNRRRRGAQISVVFFKLTQKLPLSSAIKLIFSEYYMEKSFLICLLLVSCQSLAGETLDYDYSTPEKALASLELAYLTKDIEAAINSKSFYLEAKELVEKQLGTKRATDEIIAKTENLLQLSYRRSIKENGFPDFSNVECLSSHISENEKTAILTEKCVYPDKGYSIQRLKAVRIGGEWKIGEILQ